MATTKKKVHYYVLVMTEKGPKFVTKINYGDRTAEWDYKEKPLEIEKVWAEDLARGLTWNGHTAFVVAQPWEIDYNPYRYDSYEIKWKKRKKEEEKEEE